MPDATADFVSTLNDPRRWLVKKGVPVFKAHTRVDPATKQTIRVDLAKLYRIADNMQRMERLGGVPARGTLGHTEPTRPETDQPPVAVWYRNARVGAFGPAGEPAVVCDEWLDPRYAAVRRNYPYRSAEYYDDTEQITGVALLTRDPYLDLGVVAYTADLPGPTRYSRTGAVAIGYRFLLSGTEETPMYPNAAPVPAPNGVPAAAPAPVPNAAPPAVPNAVPTPYNYGPPPHHMGHSQHAARPQHMAAPHHSGHHAGAYGDMDYTPHHIGHDHSGEGWHGGVAYAPPGAAPSVPPTQEEPDEGEAGLHMLHHHLTQAAEHLSRYLTRHRPMQYEPTMPVNSPFPSGAPLPPPNAPGAGTAEEPYARRYERSGQGTPPNAPARTISGLPVGYQMELDRLRSQITEQERAMKVLLYERDQNDTAACAAEIGRLAALGYQVGEYEVAELKSKQGQDQRAGYIQHVMSRYQRVGTESLPPLLGDPTAAMVQPENRPATEDEMRAALRMVSARGMDYNEALRYARNGGAAPAGPWTPNTDPYPEPSLNGAM
jgi:hypothetical protein